MGEVWRRCGWEMSARSRIIGASKAKIGEERRTDHGSSVRFDEARPVEEEARGAVCRGGHGRPGHELVVEWSAVALFLLVLARMIIIARRHERSEAREYALRAVGLKLVSAPGREGVYRAALDAAIGLVGKVPAARVGLALGSEGG